MRNINFYGLTGLCPSLPPICFKEKPIEINSSELEVVCKLVYAPDERTLLPSSDLTVLFSDSVPADISDWVKRNLQQPIDISSVGITPQNEETFHDNDDILAECVRGRDESVHEYISRVNGILRRMNEPSES